MSKNEKDLILSELKKFVINCLNVKYNPSEANQKQLSGEYKNTNYKARFGAGALSKIPFFAFTANDQEIQKGIYPVILYDTTRDVDNFEIAYGISETEKPNINWPSDIIHNLKNSQTKKYSKSYIKKALSINSIDNFQNNKEDILNNIDQVIDDFNKIFDSSSMQSLSFDINRAREDLILLAKNNGANSHETGEYTALSLDKNIAEIHRVMPRAQKFRIVVPYKLLDENLQQIVEKVPESYNWSNLNGSFYVDSPETFEQAKLIIVNLTNMNKKQYWTYTPGPNASKWDDFYKEGLMSICWDELGELGDLRNFNTKEKIGQALQKLKQTGNPFTNKALAGWEFVNEMQIGDVVFAKKGNDEIIGRGIVASDYEFDTNRKDYFSIRKINWTHKGSWDSKIIKDGDFAVKRLTNITTWPEFYNQIEQLILGESIMNDETINHPLNQILYGPPGTGKTYRTRKILKDLLQKQIDDLNNKNYSNDNVKIKEAVDGLSWFEVIALALYRNGKDTKHTIKNILTYKEIQLYPKSQNSKDLRATIWGRIQERTSPDSQTVNVSNKREPYAFEKTEDSLWFLTDIGKKYVEEDLSDVLEKLKAPQKYKIEDFYKFITFHQSYAYEDFIEGIKPDLSSECCEIKYILEDGIFKKICKDAKADPDNNYVLIIDEINRGNISKIFGELITLIEENKRTGDGQAEALEVALPYSKERFGVPKNLYIVGTMNTSDRSIASIDIALRRRFKFVEIMPDPKLVPAEIAGLDANFREIFELMNKKISILLDREHQIGHSYFMQVKTVDDLKSVWFNNILPLLNEYFYGEWDKLKEIVPNFVNEKKTGSLINSSDLAEEYYYDFCKESDFGPGKSFEGAIINLYSKNESAKAPEGVTV